MFFPGTVKNWPPGNLSFPSIYLRKLSLNMPQNTNQKCFFSGFTLNGSWQSFNGTQVCFIFLQICALKSEKRWFFIKSLFFSDGSISTTLCTTYSKGNILLLGIYCLLGVVWFTWSYLLYLELFFCWVATSGIYMDGGGYFVLNVSEA